MPCMRSALVGRVTLWSSRRYCIKVYTSEIASVTMLGADGELPWTVTPDGLVIKIPDRKPCEHAFVFKIVRKHPFAKTG